MKYKSFLICALILIFATFSLSFALTYDEERKYGKEIYREIVQAVPVNNDPYISLGADNIKKRLEEKALLPFPVTLTIIDSETIDAFATMGGYVYITTGLIGMCDKEEELAGVIAHEFGHVKKRHISKRMEKASATIHFILRPMQNQTSGQNWNLQFMYLQILRQTPLSKFIFTTIPEAGICSLMT